jgi:hypothetical protein
MDIFFGWIILSIIIGFVGSGRKIGFWGTFFLSLVLSPLIGLIFALISKEKDKSNLISPEVSRLTKMAIGLKFKDLNKAIELMKKALLFNPKSKQSNYNMACFYALAKDVESAKKYLSLSVKYGYNNFESIQRDSDFTWLRKQPKFIKFANNGYVEEEIKIIKTNYLDELRELGKLYEEGVITEVEFEKQKKKILDSSIS